MIEKYIEIFRPNKYNPIKCLFSLSLFFLLFLFLHKKMWKYIAEIINSYEKNIFFLSAIVKFKLNFIKNLKRYIIESV